MNTTITVKGADFSNTKVGKLSAQKLEVVKAGNGMLIPNSDGSELIEYLAPSWHPELEIVHSEVIDLPYGTKGFYGRTDVVLKTSNLDAFLNDPTALYIPGVVMLYMCYFSTNLNKWSATAVAHWENVNQRPTIKAWKNGIYDKSEYSAIQIEGPLYYPFADSSLPINKLVLQWIKPDAPQAGDIGLVVPEIYAVY